MTPKTFNQLVEANNFGYKYITSSYKPEKAIESKAKIELWHPNKITTNQEFLDHCKEVGGRPASFNEALQYALANPEEQKKNPLATYDAKQLCYLYLNFDGVKRRLHVYEDNPGSNWDDYVRFLVVPAPVSVPASFFVPWGFGACWFLKKLALDELVINGVTYVRKQIYMTQKELKEKFIEEFKNFDYDWHGIEYFKGATTGKIADWWLSALDSSLSEIEGEIEDKYGDFRGMISPDHSITGEEYTQGWNDSLAAALQIIRERKA